MRLDLAHVLAGRDDGAEDIVANDEPHICKSRPGHPTVDNSGGGALRAGVPVAVCLYLRRTVGIPQHNASEVPLQIAWRRSKWAQGLARSHRGVGEDESEVEMSAWNEG